MTGSFGPATKKSLPVPSVGLLTFCTSAARHLTSTDSLTIQFTRSTGRIATRGQPLPRLRAECGRPSALGLTTSATRRDQQRTFALFDLTPYFAVVVTADDVTHPKPNPEPYLTTAQRLDVTPASCLVIEDSTHGVMSAQRAGCTVAGLATSFSAERLVEAGALVAATDFGTLAHHLSLESS